jgi:hypothetical protein
MINTRSNETRMTYQITSCSSPAIFVKLTVPLNHLEKCHTNDVSDTKVSSTPQDGNEVTNLKVH